MRWRDQCVRLPHSVPHRAAYPASCASRVRSDAKGPTPVHLLSAWRGRHVSVSTAPRSPSPVLLYGRPVHRVPVVAEDGAGRGAKGAAAAAQGRPAGDMGAAVPIHGQPVRRHALRARGGRLLRQRCAPSARSSPRRSPARRLPAPRAAAAARGSARPRHVSAASPSARSHRVSSQAGTAVVPPKDLHASPTRGSARRTAPDFHRHLRCAERPAPSSSGAAPRARLPRWDASARRARPGAFPLPLHRCP